MSSVPITYRPLLWLAPLYWVLSAFFAALWFGGKQLYAPTDISCQRQAAGASCQLVTKNWPSPTVLRLGPRELDDASLEVVWLPQDHSYKKVELRSGGATRRLVDFTSDVRRQPVAQVNEFLSGSSTAPISARIVAPASAGSGLLLMLLLSLATFVGGAHTLARRTTFAFLGKLLEVRAHRWPMAAIVQQMNRAEIAEVIVVSRIPDGLAPTVASLPWRNIYRSTALAVTLVDGQERLLSEWSKRSRSLHERVAATIRARLG